MRVAGEAAQPANAEEKRKEKFDLIVRFNAPNC